MASGFLITYGAENVYKNAFFFCPNLNLLKMKFFHLTVEIKLFSYPVKSQGYIFSNNEIQFEPKIPLTIRKTQVSMSILTSIVILVKLSKTVWFVSWITSCSPKVTLNRKIQVSKSILIVQNSMVCVLDN